MDPSGTLSCVGLSDSALPRNLGVEYPEAKYLDVSFGKLRRFDELDQFDELKALIADQNLVSSLDSFPVMESLHTLSLNKNKISSVSNIIRNAKEKFPRLAFLSLLGNPCCPSEIDGGSTEQYKDYRKQIIAGIRTIRFIDSKPVLDEERPKTVETITDKKLRTGAISEAEHEHILKMHALISSLDEESTDLMLASSEDDDDDACEYVESPEQEYFASILAAARGIADAPPSDTPVKETEFAKDEVGKDLSVFEKIVNVSLPSGGQAALASSPLSGNAPAFSPKNASPKSKDMYTEDGGDAEPIYDVNTIAHYQPDSTTAKPSENDRKLRIAALMGALRKVTISKSPTGLDMQLVSDMGYIRVSKVTPNGAAQKAGISVGDVILSAGENGIVGASQEDAEGFMLESNTTELQIATLSMGLPDDGALAVRKYSVGARPMSEMMRPLYCEVEIEKKLAGAYGALGFTVSSKGSETVVDTVSPEVTSVKPGDIVKSINGDDVTPMNVTKLMTDAEFPVNVDIIRYMVTEGNPNISSSSGSASEAKTRNPSCKVFEAVFKGAGELSKTGKSKKPRKGSKQARKGTNEEIGVTDYTSLAKGKVKVAVFSDALTCKRVSKIPKALQQLDGKGDEILFEIATMDAFTVIKRKRKLVLMIQSKVDGQAVCYILKFSKKRDCDKACDAIMLLPGHVSYAPPKKSKKRKSKGEKSSVETKMESSNSKSASLEASISSVSQSSEAQEDAPAPRRRKLVRGANANETKVLPEYQAAMDALEDLDSFLDTQMSSDSKLAESTPHLSSGHISRAKSRKWFKEYAKIQAPVNELADDQDKGQAAEETDDDDDDDLDDLEADDEFFKALEEKRAEREREQEERRALLQQRAAEMQEKLSEQRSEELAEIEKQKAAQRKLDEEYKEYCTVGAERRLKELTFKFKWNGARPQFISDDT